jgi:hypothetical protein
MTIDEAIRDVLARGEFCDLSVHSSGKGVFRATFAPASRQGLSHAEAADPIEAMLKAIKGVKLARLKPNAAKPAADDMDFG